MNQWKEKKKKKHLENITRANPLLWIFALLKKTFFFNNEKILSSKHFNKLSSQKKFKSSTEKSSVWAGTQKKRLKSVRSDDWCKVDWKVFVSFPTVHNYFCCLTQKCFINIYVSC